MPPTKFLGGPAGGLALDLARTPPLLRMVSGPNGDTAFRYWKALDGLDDVPESHEEVHVYFRVAQNGAAYAYYDRQPPGVVTRETETWREWCVAETKRGVRG